MQNLKKIIFTLFLMFTSIVVVNAKTTIMTCEYFKPKDSFSNTQAAGVLCDIYSDYSHQCYMKVGSESATRSSNKEKIQNWGKAIGLTWQAKEYVQKNNKCPDYMLIKMDNGIDGYELHAAENMSDLMNLTYTLNGQRYQATLKGIEISDDAKKKAENEVKAYTEAINNTINNYSIESCAEQDKTITKYNKCKTIISNLKNNISEWNTNVYNWIQQGYFTEADEIIQNYRAAVRTSENFFNKSDQELEEKNKEIQNELGIGDGSKEDLDIGFVTGNLNCDGIFSREFGKILKQIMDIIKFIVPILIIGLSIVDFIKALAAQNQDELKKSANKLVIRLIIGILIFVLPTLLEFLLKQAGIEFGVCALG